MTLHARLHIDAEALKATGEFDFEYAVCGAKDGYERRVLFTTGDKDEALEWACKFPKLAPAVYICRRGQWHRIY